MNQINHVDLPADIAGWLDVLRQIKNKRAELDEEGRVNGKPAVKWTRVTSHRLDQKQLKATVSSDVLAACYVEQTTRRLTLVDGDQ